MSMPYEIQGLLAGLRNSGVITPAQEREILEYSQDELTLLIIAHSEAAGRVRPHHQTQRDEIDARRRQPQPLEQ